MALRLGPILNLRVSLSVPRPNLATRTSSLYPAVSCNRAGRLCTRTMSSSSSPSNECEWLAILPDKEGALQKRLEVRPTHFANLGSAISSGKVQMGGALLNRVPSGPADLDFAGSTIVVRAASKEEAMEFIKKDIYAREGVWDMDKVMIWPFKCAVRTAVDMPAQK